MNANIRMAVLLLVGATAAFAEPPASARVVVLDNENLIEGEVSRTRDGYNVRRSRDGDMELPASRVLAVVADRAAAFDFVIGRSNRRDADERLRIARWCRDHDMLDRGLLEAQAAVRMRPGFVAAERYVRTLQLEIEAQKKAPAPEVVQVKAEVPVREPVKAVEPIEYNTESFPMFATKVHAILQNACARCHATAEVKAFRMTRRDGRAALNANLTAALAQVNPAQPASSPLLTKAIAPHGTATEPPLKNAQHPAYKTLETWAHFARATEGTPMPDEIPAAARPAEPMKLPAFGSDRAIEETPRPSEPKEAGPKTTGFADSPRPAVPTAPVRTPVDDPFDPETFNRQGPRKK